MNQSAPPLQCSIPGNHKRPALLLAAIISVSLLMGCIGDTSAFFDRDDDDNDDDNAGVSGQIFAVTASNQLISFADDTPGMLDSREAITGLAGNESIIGIDFRPSTNDLYAVTDQGNIYIVDTEDGSTRIDSTAAVIPNGASFGVDFNPVVDRLRQLSNVDQNLSINPDNGNTQTDISLSYAAGDINVGSDPAINATAYSNSFRGPTTTTLFAIDTELDCLVRLDPIEDGTLNTIGNLGVGSNEFTAMDIEANGRAFAALTQDAANTSELYRINLSTGAATLVDTIAGGEIIIGLAVQTPRTPVVFAISNTNLLISFNPQTPDTLINSINVTGLFPSEQILDIDFRPETGELYALTNQSNLYVLNTNSGLATLSSTLDTPLAGTFFGMDFDAVLDRLRIVNDTGQNLRINDVENDEVNIDDPLNYDSGDDNDGATPSVVSLAHTNSFESANSTMVYAIDSSLDVLVLVSDPANGELQTIGDLDFDTSGLTGFDIAGNDGLALAAMNNPGLAFSQLFTLDLETGEATLVDTISNINVTIIGLAILLPAR